MAITTIPEVREEIQQNINTNNNRAITGQVLQNTLIDMLDTVDDVKANTTGYYEGMSVGLADNLISPDTENDSASWLYRSTAGDKDVSSGFATIEGMKGNTIVWNQLNSCMDFIPYSASNVTATKNGNTFTVVVGGGGPSGSASINITNADRMFTSGHVFYLSCKTDYTLTKDFSVIKWGPSNQAWFSTNKIVWRWPSDQIVQSVFGFRYETTTLPGTYNLSDIMVIDLTKMFGSDANIAATLGITTAEITTDVGVAAFEKWLEENVGPKEYYAYDEGSLLSFNPTDIQTTGFNQYDNSKQTENVHVLADQKYRIKGTYTGLTYSDGSNVTVTDGYFTPDRVDRLTLTGGNSVDTCVHLSWSGWRDPVEDYEPYWQSDTDLSWIRQIQYQGAPLFPNGLCKAGDVYDEISDGKAIKRVGVVDLGTLAWFSSSDKNEMYTVSFTDKKIASSGDKSIICSKFEVRGSDSWGAIKANNCIYNSYTNSKEIYIGTEDRDADAFKIAMSGVMLNYELATPIVVDLPDGINLNCRMDDFGTEELVNLDAAVNTPGLCKPTLVEIGYQTNLRDKIRRLDDNYVSLNLQENSESKKLTARQNIDAAATSGSYPQMTVGNLIADVDTPREFTFDQTGGGGTVIGNGYADVKKIEGNTIVWNQLVKNGNFSNGITNWNRFIGCTISVSEGTMTVTSDTSTGEHYCTQEISNIIASHKYYCSITLKTDGTSASTYPMLFIGGEIRFLWATNDNVFEHLSVIVTAGTGTLNAVRLYTPLGGTTQFKNIQILDLTKMFGAGNEPTTVEEFERLFPIEYAPYCEGRLVSLGGYKIKWNQLVQNGNFESVEGWYAPYGTISVSNNVGIYTNESTASTARRIECNIEGKANHQYYVSFNIKNTKNTSGKFGVEGDATIFSYSLTADNYVSLSRIIKTSFNFNIVYYYIDTTNVMVSGDLTYFKDFVIIDLTEMFGPGSEPTLEEFEAMFGTQYSPYDAGTEMNVLEKMELQDDLTVKSTGFNQWDEEWELGSYNTTTGEFVSSNNSIINKNSIKVLPSTSYYIQCPATSAYWILFYRSDGTFISSTQSFSDSYSFTTPANCEYIDFIHGYSGSPITTYNHDICINLSDPAKNGTYLPYTTSTQDLSWIYDLEYTPEGSETPEKLFPYGLLSAGSVHDEVTDTGAVKRVGVVDLGDLHGWSYGQYTSGQYYFNCAVSKMRQGDFYNVTTKNSKYTDSYWSYVFSNGTDKCLFTYGANNTICITDSSIDESVISGTAGTSSATIPMFSGIRLYYELAEPITVTFPSSKDLGYNVQSGGTEELLPTNPSGSGPITAPVLLSVNYPLDAVGTLTNLPRNYISVASMDSFTTALGNFLNANITRTWDATNEKYTFTMVSRT